MEKINLDEGFAYGLGVFETMAVVNERVIFADRHLRRLQEGLATMGIEGPKEIEKHFENNDTTCINGVKKVVVTSDNIVVNYRENPYTKADYERGFNLEIARIKRNETSPFTYIKSLNYGDNIVAKREAKQQGVDEPIFLNSRGGLTEGATTNIFFCHGNKIYTPSVASGLLPGIMRGWIMENVAVSESEIYFEYIKEFDEMFIANSVLGIMPVARLGNKIFYSRENAKILCEKYEAITNI